MENTITVQKAVERSSFIIIDRCFYEANDVVFSAPELETVLDVYAVQNPDSWDKGFGKISYLAQGNVAGRWVIVSFR